MFVVIPKGITSAFSASLPHRRLGLWVEVHHFATNFTIVNGKVTGSPNFYGTNPAEIREGPRKGLRVLGAEEDAGRELLMALTPEQKKVAVLTRDAYKDIITAASRKASLDGQPSGLSISKMNRKQKALLQTVIESTSTTCPTRSPRLARNCQESRQQRAVRLGWRRGKGRAALLPCRRARIHHRVRQHAGQRQPRPQRLARYQRRLRPRSLAQHYKTSHNEIAGKNPRSPTV